ncbi:hypothetical protein WJX73_003884 [Symbiochloris irregularis]|uniref:RING-type domain-containing protein n=1 Tax=Symbiochloris irregularis TaxID=706552 RepID=A0AAW1NZJ4_9CHLO
MDQWSDFGQKVDLCARIRQILQDYGEGTSIFKELLQNADDAGASKVSFCLDYRHHATESLSYQGFAPLQGPALYAYNNAVFTEGDFQSISRIGDSIKRSESNKTGRFGVGFNATYHITDVPSFCSGKHCVYFDPHCLYLPNLSALNPGKMIDFVAAKPSLLEQFPDQFQPFCAFGCDMRTEFPGTLFRLPLRTAALAIKSRISQQVYDPAKVKRMLDAVASEAVTMMLLSKALAAPAIPWGAVAARLPADSDAGVSGVDGQAFCFLPLPARTGLPLHINAFFELSSNRRDIWYAPDLVESSKLRCDWNISLLEDVALRDCPVVYTSALGGRWLRPSEAIYADQSSQGNTALLAASIAVGMPMASTPPEATRLLLQHAMNQPHLLMPTLLRSHMRSHTRLAIAACQGSDEHAAAIASYSIEDIYDEDEQSIQQLSGVPLQLGNRSVHIVGSGSDICVLTEDEQLLLASESDLFIRTTHMSAESHARFLAIAATGVLDIKRLDLAALQDAFLKRMLPSSWRASVEVTWSPDGSQIPNFDWLSKLWTWLQACDLGDNLSWPLVPVAGDVLVWLPANIAASTLLWQGSLDPGIRWACQDPCHKLGCRFVSAAFKLEQHPLLQDERDRLRQFLLMDKWHKPPLTADALQTLKALPIFQTACGAAACSAPPGCPGHASLLDATVVVPEGLLPELLSNLPPTFIVASNSMQSRVLGDRLGVRQLKPVEFYRTQVFPNLGSMEPSLRDRVMTAVLLQLNQLEAADKAIIHQLSRTAFVTTADGSLQPPCSLYDPRSPELTLLDSARYAERLQQTDPAAARERGKSLLAHLELEAERLLGSGRTWGSPKPLAKLFARTSRPEQQSTTADAARFWTELAQIAWCPVLTEPPALGCPCIFTGHGFVSTDKVALKGPLNLAPWLVIIPSELTPFNKLFSMLGASASFSARQYISTLHEMATVHGTSEALPSGVLDQALSITQDLSGMSILPDAAIYVPDHRDIMQLATSLLFNDAPWTADPDARFVHPKLSFKVAEAVGCMSMRRSMLAGTAASMQLGFNMQSFGQSEALTTRLKHIIDAYADGPGILLELVQNADDAGATEVAFMLDEESYGTNSILGPNMSHWQGPALCCYNNGVFSEADFHNISRIGQDSKLDKPAATGRFGLGFNANYHLTDLPSFVSGSHIVMFDPSAKYLPNVSPAQPGLKIAFTRANLLRQFPDTFAPYLHFGCTMQQPFDGTLFRFPLRTEETAEMSEIKKEPYTLQAARRLLEAFQESAGLALLFLKSVQTISTHIRHSDGTVELLQRVNLQCQGGATPQASICSFLQSVNQRGQKKFHDQLRAISESRLPRYCELVKVTSQAGGDAQQPGSQNWLVTAGLGGTRPREMTLAQNSRGLVPWAGIAARLHPDHLLQESGNLASGRAFCFLPLPVSVGMPVHVNGYFELSSNRRDIWTEGVSEADLAGQGLQKARWNQALLEDLAAPLYADLLLAATQHLKHGSAAYYALWPAQQPREPWAQLAQQLYLRIEDSPLIWSQANGGQWLKAGDALFPDEACRSESGLADLLIKDGCPLCIEVPAAVAEQILLHTPGARQLTPAQARAHLKSNQRHPALCVEDVEQRSEVAKVLLEYCMSDFDLSDTRSVAQLKGLPLCMLANGSLTPFQGNGGLKFVLTDEQHDLLAAHPSAILVWKAGSPLGDRLAACAAINALNLSLLTADALANVFLPALLPATWRDEQLVTWRHDGELTAASVSSDWLKRLWSMLLQFPDLSPLSAWPLVPVQGERLCRADPAAQIMSRSEDETVSSALTKLGFQLIDIRMGIDVSAPVMRKLLYPSNAKGILQALAANVKNKPAALTQKVRHAALTPHECHQLSAFLLQVQWYEGGDILSKSLKNMLCAMPIFEEAQSSAAMAAGSGSAATFLDLTQPRQLAPQGTRIDILPGSTFVRAHSDAQARILVDHLGVKRLSQTEVLQNHVFHRIRELSPDVRNSTMLNMCQDLPSLILSNRQLKAELTTLEFLPTAQSGLAAPSRLYDPRNSALTKLLDPNKHFPAYPFDSDEILDALTLVGLRDTLTIDVMAEAAKALENEDSESPSASAMERAAALLGQLDLLAISEAGQEASESAERSAAWDALQRKRLGWAGPVSAISLASQLVELGRMHEVLAEDMDEERTHALEAAVVQLYQALATSMMDNTDVIVPILQSSNSRRCCCIWTGLLGPGAGFAEPGNVATNSAVSLRPYLFSLPQPLLPFRDLFAIMQVADEYGPQHYARGLARVMDEQRTKGGNQPLTEAQMDAVLQMAGGLAEIWRASSGSLHTPLVLPDANGIMAPILHLFVNDADWLAKDKRLLHEAIDPSIGRALGVKSLRYHHQVAKDKTADLGCPQARSVADLLTKHQASLGQDGLAELQGPAVCFCIHGVTLKPQELTILQQPGSPYRLRDVTCTYGTGLQAAYSIADVVTVLSGDSLHMWDPQAMYLKPDDSGGSEVGKRFQHAGSDLVTKFEHQFVPWRFAGMDVGQEINATLIRLPLRTAEQATMSKLSVAAPTIEDVSKGLESLSRDLGRSLLFLGSLRTLRTLQWSPASSDPVAITQVSLIPSAAGTRLPFTEADLQRPSGNRLRALGGLLRGKRDMPNPRKTATFSLISTQADGAMEPEYWRCTSAWGLGNTRRLAFDSKCLDPPLVPAVAIAVKLAHRDVQPASGLFAPLPIRRGVSCEAADADHLQKLPFLLCANFALDASSGRQLYGLQAPPVDLNAVQIDQLAVAELRAAFNQELLQVAGLQVWLDTFEAIRNMQLVPNTQSSYLPCTALYSLIPDIPEPEAAEQTLAGHAAAAHLCKQICLEVGRRSVWHVRTGPMVTLSDGCFLQTRVDHLGDKATDFIKRAFPLFSADWRVKVALEAAGVAACSELQSPGRGSEDRTMRATLEAMGLPMPTEGTPLDALLQSSPVRDTFNRLRSLLDQQAGVGPAVGTPPVTAGPGNPEAATAPVLALRWMREDSGLLDGTYDAATLQDCLGLPVGTAAGDIVTLGSRRLFAWSHTYAVSPLTIIPARHKDTYKDFLHPDVVEQLGAHLASQEVLQALKLEQYHVAACEQHLRMLGHPRWRRDQDVRWKDLDGQERLIDICSQQGLLQADLLSSQHGVQLFDYLCKELPDGSRAAFLASLPIFPTVAGSRVPAAGLGHVRWTCPTAVVDAVVGRVAAIPFSLRDGYLLHLEHHLQLYERIHVPIHDDAQLIRHILLPNFDAELKQVLADTEFVPVRHSEPVTCKRPRDLYDPTSPLLEKIFQAKQVFPAEDFSTPAWLEVLRAAGLKSEITAEIFLMCAREVATWRNDLQGPDLARSEFVWSCALELGRHYADSASAFHPFGIYGVLRNLKCFPATKGLPGSSSCTRLLISSSEAVLQRDWALAWTVAPILQPNCEPPHFTFRHLQITSPPILATVMSHLEQVGRDAGEQTLANWPSSAGSVEDVFGRVLRHLSAQGLNTRQQGRLRDVAFIPVANATRLAAPTQLFIRLPGDLAPLAFEVPVQLVSHMALLQELGVAESATTEKLISLLQGMAASLGRCRLNTNEVQAVVRVLQALCAANDAASAQQLQLAWQRGDLAVPAASSRLVPVGTCVHKGSAPARMLNRVDLTKVTLVHPLVSTEVCQKLGMPALENIVTEQLDDRQPLQIIDSIQGMSCEAAQQLLVAPWLVAAVHQVVRQYSQQIPALRDRDQQKLSVALQNASKRLHFVRACHTRLVRSPAVDVTRTDVPSQVYFFADAMSGMLLVAEPPDRVPLSAILAQAISAALPSPVPLPLDAMLIQQPSAWTTLQSALVLGTGGEEMDQAGSAGQLGTPVLPHDLDLVQLRPLRPYALGELCAFSADLVPEAPAPDSRGVRLVYGRAAASTRPPSNAAVYHVSVEVAPGQFAQLLSSQVYSFRSGAQAAGAQSSGASHPRRPEAHQPVHLSSATDSAAGGGPNARAAEESGTEGAAAIRAISPSEAMSAMRDMLAAAGVVMSEDRAQMVQESLTLREQLTSAQAQTEAARRDVMAARAEAEAGADAAKCKICLAQDANAAMIACGHMLCASCAGSCRQSCPFCRKASNFVKLFR